MNDHHLFINFTLDILFSNGSFSFFSLLFDCVECFKMIESKKNSLRTFTKFVKLHRHTQTCPTWAFIIIARPFFGFSLWNLLWFSWYTQASLLRIFKLELFSVLIINWIQTAGLFALTLSNRRSAWLFLFFGICSPAHHISCSFVIGFFFVVSLTVFVSVFGLADIINVFLFSCVCFDWLFFVQWTENGVPLYLFNSIVNVVGYYADERSIFNVFRLLLYDSLFVLVLPKQCHCVLNYIGIILYCRGKRLT